MPPNKDRNMMSNMMETLRSIQQRDPAARSLLQIALLYPGVRIMVFHRLANFLWRHGLYFLGRLVSELGRFFCGIEIHPGARIGKRFFIDHGLGVVIGETAEIGDDVTLYHGVTLGGLSPDDGVGGNRHPKIMDRAVIGAGAQVLGPVVINPCARIGANAVVIKDVPACAIAVGNPARVITQTGTPETTDTFEPYGVTRDDIPDPTAKVIKGLMAEIAALRAQVEDSQSATPRAPTASTEDRADLQ